MGALSEKENGEKARNELIWIVSCVSVDRNLSVSAKLQVQLHGSFPEEA